MAEPITAFAALYPDITLSLDLLLLSGAGVAWVPDRLMSNDVKAGKAVKVLPLWQALPVDSHLLFRSRAQLPQRVCLMIDYIVDTLTLN